MTLLLQDMRGYSPSMGLSHAVVIPWRVLPDTDGPSRRRGDKPQTADPASSILAGKRVVIVEDEGLTVWQLRKLLERAGLEIAGAASNGQAGIETVLRVQPDLVLMDVTMPLVNGLDAARRILEQVNTCMVMITAYDEYREEAERLGATGYVVKPVMQQTLIAQLEEAYTRFMERSSGPSS